MDPDEKRILAVTSFGHFLSHYNTLVFPAIVLPLSHRLGLDLSTALGLSFFHYLLFGVSALPWGLAADRWGAKPFMLIYFAGAGICGVLAAVFIDRPAVLIWALAGIGLFSGIYHPVGLGLISKGVRRLSLVMGYNGMFGNVGLAAAPLITGLVNQVWGPKGAYYALAILNFAALALMIFSRIDEPDRSQAQAGGAETNRVSPFLVLLVAMMLGGVAYSGATVILPAYFELKGPGIYQALASLLPVGLSANLVATAMASVIYLIGIFGQLAGGKVGERFEARKSYLVFHLLTLPPVFLMALAADFSLLALAVVYFFFLLGMQPVENTLVARLTPQRFHHSAYGAKFILTFGVGSLAVKMVGAIESGWGLEYVYPALGCVSIGLVFTVLVLMTRTGPVGGKTPA